MEAIALALIGFFFFLFATDNGLKRMALPTILTSLDFSSSAGVAAVDCVGAAPVFSSLESSVAGRDGSGLSLLKAGSAPVLKLTPAPSPGFLASFVRFGAGRNELKPPRPPVRGFFAGRSSSSFTSGFIVGRSTLILRGADGSATF